MAGMILIPIKENLHDNPEFISHPDCQESIYMSVAFFKNIGYHFPWIGYYASVDGELVGSAAFKGRPLFGKVEIAYGIFPQYRQRGLGTEICKQLVDLSLQTDSSVLITARTLKEENYSVRILRKNGFHHLGVVVDIDDGEVWEWEYRF
jgi:[ribosomal protein S5]-alanine N-acetyltransferase